MATAIEAALTKVVLEMGRDVRGLLLAETPFRDGVLTTDALNLGSASGAASGQLSTSGSVGVGVNAAGNTRLYAKGQDTSTSNYGLVIANSSNVSLISVRNDGLITTSGTLIIGGSLVVNGGYGLLTTDIPSLDASKITSGTFATAQIPSVDASKITSGTVATARLGGGAASAATLLFGDSTWAALAATDIPSLDAAKITTGTIATARLSGVALTGSANTFSGLQSLSTLTTSGSVGVGVAVAGNTRLYAKAQDSTSSNYGLVIANSGGTSMLYIRDDSVGYLNTTAWTYASDASKKRNIRPLNKDIVDFMKLEPKMFDYINGPANRAGYLAQEVQLVYPELVETTDDGSLGMRTDELIPLFNHVLRRLILLLVTKGVIGPADLA